MVVVATACVATACGLHLNALVRSYGDELPVVVGAESRTLIIVVVSSRTDLYDDVVVVVVGARRS